MEIEPGTTLIKNGIVNEYTQCFRISEGDRFELLSNRSKTHGTMRVMRVKDGTTYTMYAYHFTDSNGKIIEACIWR